MIRVGTSGFSYKDWEGVFYPKDLAPADRLTYYAHEFDTVEINFSYYRIPTARTLAAMAKKTPPDFVFTIKAFRGLTHERTDNAADFAAFIKALAPWRATGKLGCVLAQFPNSFRNTPANRAYLRYLKDQMGDIPTVVEFRHRDWIKRSIFALLQELELGICCVDQPRLPTLVPPFAIVTSDIGYVRFHGRNASKWWVHKEAWERYDYDYKPEELVPWIPRIHDMATKAHDVYVFTNNHWQGQAVDTARQLKMMLLGGEHE